MSEAGEQIAESANCSDHIAGAGKLIGGATRNDSLQVDQTPIESLKEQSNGRGDPLG